MLVTDDEYHRRRDKVLEILKRTRLSEWWDLHTDPVTVTVVTFNKSLNTNKNSSTLKHTLIHTQPKMFTQLNQSTKQVHV